MKFRHFVPALLISALTLNGCTVFLWGENNPFHKTTTEKTVAKDNIQAFGVVAKDNTQLKTGSLVMMGKKYWFVVNPRDSAKLKAVLDVKLDKQFQMVQQNPRYVYKALPVELKSPEAHSMTKLSTRGVFLPKVIITQRRKMLPKTAVLTLPFRSEFIIRKPKKALTFRS